MRALACLEPDLVINTGDNLAHLEAVPAAGTRSSRCWSDPGAFVLGSNDYFAPKPKNPARYLTRNHARRTAATPPAHRGPGQGADRRRAGWT